MITKEVIFNRNLHVFSDRPSHIVEMLENTAAQCPEQEALIRGNKRLTYSEMKKKVDDIAANLQKEYKIKKGDRIALLMGNSIEFALMIFAAAKNGAIVVPLNTRLKEPELAYMINHSGAKLIFTDEEFLEKIEQLRRTASGDLKKIEHVFLICHTNQTYQRSAYIPFSSLMTSNSDFNKVIINEEDPLFIMYTSGTTGVPKGAVGSHIGIIHSAKNYELVLGTDATTKTLIAVPLFHVTGLIGQLLHIVLVGGTSVLMNRYKTEPFIRITSEENITFLFNVPSIYVLMMSHPSFSHYSYHSVKTIAYGGAPMSHETIDALRDEFPNAHLQNAYGATETSSPATIMPVVYPDTKLNSVGRPVPVGELKVVDEQGQECGPNRVGELLIKGPMVVEGYWDNDKANANSFRDGYWVSGDVAKIDKDGFVYIMDRKKDVINRGGEKVFSVEVENVLYSHPDILEAAVAGIPDDIFGEKVKAYIVKKEGREVTDKNVRDFVSEHLADYKIPQYVAFVDTLPRNPGGKVIKAQLS